MFYERINVHNILGFKGDYFSGKIIHVVIEILGIEIWNPSDY